MNKLKQSYIFFNLVIPVISLPSAKYDLTCQPTDCSQPRNFRFDGDHKFPCSILQLKGFQEFAKKVNITNILLSNKCINIGLLESVDVYVRRYDDSPQVNLALNLSFIIPFHQQDGFEHRSIVMQFKGIPDKWFADSHYSKEERVRVFNFTSYMPSKYDRDHPRHLQYDCLVGLAKQDFRVYKITFSMLPSGAKIIYYIATYNQLKDKDWKPTVAIAALPNNRIHVVFEKAPESFGVTEYKIDLVHWPFPNPVGPALHSTVIPQSQKKNSHIFQVPADGGAFSVMILPRGDNCQHLCSKPTSSYKLEFPATVVDLPVDPMKILYAVLGSCVALLLILILVSFLIKTNINRICRLYKQDKKLLQTQKSNTETSHEQKRFIELPQSDQTRNPDENRCPSYSPPDEEIVEFIPPSPFPSDDSEDDLPFHPTYPHQIGHHPSGHHCPPDIPQHCRTGICHSCNNPNIFSPISLGPVHNVTSHQCPLHHSHHTEEDVMKPPSPRLKIGASFSENQESLKNILFSNGIR